MFPFSLFSACLLPVSLPSSCFTAFFLFRCLFSLLLLKSWGQYSCKSYTLFYGHMAHHNLLSLPRGICFILVLDSYNCSLHCFSLSVSRFYLFLLCFRFNTIQIILFHPEFSLCWTIRNRYKSQLSLDFLVCCNPRVLVSTFYLLAISVSLLYMLQKVLSTSYLQSNITLFLLTDIKQCLQIHFPDIFISFYSFYTFFVC